MEHFDRSLYIGERSKILLDAVCLMCSMIGIAGGTTVGTTGLLMYATENALSMY